MTNSGSDFSTVKVGDKLWVRKDSYEGPAVVYALLGVLDVVSIKRKWWDEAMNRGGVRC